ncbi:MAG: hypothetical protein K2N54_02060 [Helicobacter sp.]|nr:hypothetical protein [Helicobacter sp.]
MKKLVLAGTLFASAFALELGGLEVSPEFGAIVGRLDGGVQDYGAGGYARVWVGAGGILIAPQVRYAVLFNRNDTYEQSVSDVKRLKNLQYGVALGTNLDAGILRITPYVAANYSHFDKVYKEDFSYSVGFKVKPTTIPLSIGAQFEQQKPEIKNPRTKQKINTAQVFIGVHF